MRIQPVSFANNRQQLYNKQNFNNLSFNITDTVSFGEKFNYEARLKTKMEQRPWIKRVLGLGKKAILKELNNELIGYNIAQETLLLEKEATIKAKEEALKAKEEARIAAEEKARVLQEQIVNAKENNNSSKAIAKLTQELRETQKKYEELQLSYSQDKSRYDKTVQEQQMLAKRVSGKGWDRYVGRENLKKQLQEVFINKLPQEKNYGDKISFPNGILIYGQHGTGKTYFTPAFAEQAGCHFEEIDMSEEPDTVISDLHHKLISAKKRYQNEQQRTIILLDDFNTIAELSDEDKKYGLDFDDTAAGQLAAYLNDCAKKYYATIVMTTNYPANVDSEILSKDRVPFKIFLGPPNMHDMALLFKHYLQNCNIDEDTIDYNELAEQTARAIENNQAFSSQGIVNVVNECKRLADKAGTKITQADLLKTIKTVGPDISSKQFDQYLDNMQYLVDKPKKRGQKR